MSLSMFSKNYWDSVETEAEVFAIVVDPIDFGGGAMIPMATAMRGIARLPITIREPKHTPAA